MKIKRIKTETIFLIFCQGIAVAALVFSFHRIYEIKELVKDPTNLRWIRVVGVYCNATLPSTLKIDLDGETKIISVRKKLCRSLSEGDSVQLYYHKSSDFFFEPGNRRFERGIYGLLTFLFLSFIPWSKFRR